MARKKLFALKTRTKNAYKIAYKKIPTQKISTQKISIITFRREILPDKKNLDFDNSPLAGNIETKLSNLDRI